MGFSYISFFSKSEVNSLNYAFTRVNKVVSDDLCSTMFLYLQLKEIDKFCLDFHPEKSSLFM
jgi:hypothetical protein